MLVRGIVPAAVLTLFLCTIVHAQEQQPDRVRHPLAVKIGSEGLGVDLTMLKPLAMDVTLGFFSINAKLRWLILPRNATPYVGVGVGGWGEPGGNRNRWAVVHAGWEVSGRSLLLQFFVQYAFDTLRPENHVPFPAGFHVGYRF
jgi:hypothetical protein